MADSKGPGFPDNMMSAAILPLRDIAADPFIQSTVSSSGWDIVRGVQISQVQGSRRLWQRDKELSFRPKFAGFNQEQVNYRNFLDDDPGAGKPPDVPTPPGGGDPIPTPTPGGGTPPEFPDTPTGVNSVGAAANTAIGPATIKGVRGIKASGGGAIAVGIGAGAALGAGRRREIRGWNVSSYDVGFEMSLVGDRFGKLKKTPTWQPSNMNSENRSTLIMSRQPLEQADKGDIDLAPRYFGRLHDVIIPVSTQEGVKLSRFRFKGGNAHKKKTQSTEEYTDGVFKGALNITPFDRPINSKLQQKNEEDGGPGKQGFTAHPYPDNIIKDSTEPDIYHQGGWMFDGRQEALAQIHDIIMIDGVTNASAKLPRYKNRFKKNVSISTIRHDAHFLKEGGDD